ncbi:MAG: ShlB/FhaC/HecB family hemolysin secretion/activation protein [Desulfobacterales bacterium]|nr:ShlB/FhaC/HecB family hemolysin secretion/activation protein [Desulfobacterales bacterium]
MPAIGAPCREIKTITINGAPNLPASVRKRIITEFTGRCLNVGDIERILAEITKSYIDRGYITTRAYLPPQDLSKGHLEILVIEGVVEKIIIEDGNANSISIGNVFPGVEGDLLNLRDLEQGLDQINRLASNDAQLDIQPGEKPGTSRVVVRNQPRSRFHFYATVDNQGSESTGELQAGLTASGDNLLGFNEMLSATHRESIPGDSGHKDARSNSVYFSLPFGYTTLSLGASRSDYDSPIRLSSGRELIASGKDEINYVRLDRVMYRNQSTHFWLTSMLTTKTTKNYLDDQFLNVSSRSLTVLDLDGNLSTGFLGGVLTLNLGYAQGLDALGALHDPDHLPDWAARAQFGKYKAGLNYARPFRLFNKNASFSSQVSAQKANDTLYGSEQISIGGLYSVRGYVHNTLAGDDGYYWRNEIALHQPLAIGSNTISTRIYAGYDTGKVENRATTLQQSHLSGMVVGLSAYWRDVSLDLFNTWPLTTLPDTMPKESSQIWFRISYSI